MEDISLELSQYISQLNFEDISPIALAGAKKSTLDTIAAMLAGSTAPGIEILVDLAKRWGGAEEAHLIGFGLKLPVPLAAWCNGTMARALEIDDCLDFLPIHPSASIVPALLALAEFKGGLSGRDFLTAVVVGQDIIIRFGLAVRQNVLQSGRNNLFNIFGPTAALSKAMKFTPEEVQNAMGISFSYAIGDAQCLLDGALTVRLQQGIVAQGALLSVLLASRKFTGARNYLLGEYGYFRAFEPNPKLEYLMQDLGKVFYGERITIKPFSACRGTHAAIELALKFRNDTQIDINSIRRITVWTSPEIYQLLGHPHEAKIKPVSASAAQFSLQFVIAATIVRGDFFLRELQPEVLKDNKILNLAQRVYVKPDPSLRTDLAVGKTVMEIELEGHSTVKQELDMAMGIPSRPIDYEACVGKFMKCGEFSVRQLGKLNLEKLVELVSQLENLPDVSVLLSFL
jgi:2-methylcitrate dehydratase PrpD